MSIECRWRTATEVYDNGYYVLSYIDSTRPICTVYVGMERGLLWCNGSPILAYSHTARFFGPIPVILKETEHV
jgi:hypothetical protein